MTRFICVHGHFYQPPRENPWLESIEIQESAYPFHDWNERVTAECYTPNSAARILDSEGRIARIVNNYERISFNFGPTLLHWLEKESPDTYARILDADAESRKRFGGHGSAIAQAYNHTILPLANARDKRTQVVWGIRDFESRFRRFPEGMWLPETAVDLETLETLAAFDISFTILEPGQARRVRKIGSDTWIDVTDRSIDTTRPYRVLLPSGRSITTFFYDGPTSRAVAFERLLSSGELLASRLKASTPKTGSPRLVHIATDGETFGHHHPHGDMALAWALDDIDHDPDIELTNYSAFLEHGEPEWEVEIIENTSWSCAHGVERWRSDCGCETGGRPGWDQSWRAPLREAFDWLRDTVHSQFVDAAGTVFVDPWLALDDYIEVILDRSPESTGRFFDHHGRGTDDATRHRGIKLMELQRNAQLMYTSCGWFFNDVSGIETIQVLRYAARVVELAEQLFGISIEGTFLEKLDASRSNLSEAGSAATLYRTKVLPSRIALPDVVAHYAVASIFHSPDDGIASYCFEFSEIDERRVSAGTAELAVGRVSVQSRITMDRTAFTWALVHFGGLSISGGVREFKTEDDFDSLASSLREAFDSSDIATAIRILDRELGDHSFSIRSLLGDERRAVLRSIWHDALSDAREDWRRLYDTYVPLMKLHAETAVPLPKTLRLVAELSINLALENQLEQNAPRVSTIERLLREARLGPFDVDHELLTIPLSRKIREATDRFDREPSSSEAIDDLNRILEVAAPLPLSLDVWRTQNTWFTALERTLPEMRARSEENDQSAIEWIRRFLVLGDHLGAQGSSVPDAAIQKHRQA